MSYSPISHASTSVTYASAASELVCNSRLWAGTEPQGEALDVAMQIAMEEGEKEGQPHTRGSLRARTMHTCRRHSGFVVVDEEKLQIAPRGEKETRSLIENGVMNGTQK